MVAESEFGEMTDAAERLSEAMTAAGLPYKVAVVDPALLEEIDKNAHYMKLVTFQRLVENVKRDGGLSSVPFCWKREDGVFVVLSGNHRVKGAVKAGVPAILILYDDRPLSLQKRRAIQLSHNAIVGEDDPAILKDLWSEIGEINWKEYSGLDDKRLEQMMETSVKALGQAIPEYRTVIFLFLPEEEETLKNALGVAQERLVGESAYLYPLRLFEGLVNALDVTKASWKTFNTACAFAMILKVFERHVVDLQEGWLGTDADGNPLERHKEHVPLETLLGTSKVPAPVLKKIKKVWERILGSGTGVDLKLDPWRVLDLMADRYLEGK